MVIKGTAKIYTHLWYARGAEDAAKFYASVFPDSRVDHVWSLPVESPSGPAGSVRVVDFTLLGQRFQAISAGPHVGRLSFDAKPASRRRLRSR